MQEDDFFVIVQLMQASSLESYFHPFLQWTFLDRFFTNPPERSQTYMFAFAEIYLSSSWLAQSWYSGYIPNSLRRNHFNQLMRAAVILQSSQLWSMETFFKCMRHREPIDLSHAFFIFQRAGLFTPENLEILDRHENLEGLSNLLFILNEQDLLTQTNFRQIAAHSALEELFIILNLLNRYKGWLLNPSPMLNPFNLELVLAHQNPIDLEFALNFLHDRDLLNQEHFQMLTATDKPELMAYMIEYLRYANILERENLIQLQLHENQQQNLAYLLYALLDNQLLNQIHFNALMQHQGLNALTMAIRSLIDNEIILSQDCFLAILAHHHPHELAKAMLDLKQNDLLLKKYFKVICQFEHPINLAWALGQLSQKRILTEIHYSLLIIHEQPRELALGLSLLDESGILNARNRGLLLQHAEIIHVVAICYHLHQSYLLTEENFNQVIRYPRLQVFANAIYYFGQTDTLNQDNFLILLQITNLENFVGIFHYMYQANFLTELTFHLIIDPAYAVLATPNALRLIWSRLPAHLLRRHWWAILEHCRLNQDLDEVVLNLNRLMQQTPRPRINVHQSTHTASVHASVAASAVRLMQRYGNSMNTKLVFEEMTHELEKMPRTYKVEVALRGFKRISEQAHNYKDPSGIDLHLLLVLIWRSIHDEDLRQGHLENTLTLLVDGLYEIQRGYNLNEYGGDNPLEEDSPICGGGAFNKLIEKLQGVHPDAEIIYLTPALAGFKLPKIVQQETALYFQGLLAPRSTFGLYWVIDLIMQLEQDGVVQIWPHIVKNITARIFAEFGSLYQGIDDTRLTNLIEQGQWLNYQSPSNFKDQLMLSKGYRKHSSLLLSQNNLFAQQYLRLEPEHQSGLTAYASSR